MARRLVIALGLLGFFATSARAQLQQSHCADCHFANPGAPGHLTEWDRSPHGRNNVGCDRCHGGNADAFEGFLAHGGILNGRNPAAPTYRSNLPITCGKCHIGPFVEFQKSRHYALLRGGDRNVPTCTTCHEEVAAHLLSPNALARKCAECHTPGGPAAEREYPAQGKLMLEGVEAAREDLDRAKALIRRVKDKQRRGALEETYRQAQAPLVEATEAGHAFVFDNLQERLSVARQRIDALLDQLANTGAR